MRSYDNLDRALSAKIKFLAKDKFDGLRLKAYRWEVKPLVVSEVKSSFFSDENIFPKGSITFDNALLMTNIEHEWKSETGK